MTYQVNNKRIAKNTAILFCRTIITVLISLYTSRIVLNQLGVEDYGIYNVVGGIVGMFAIITSAMSSSISRYITYELGRGDSIRLSNIFSTSIHLQLLFIFLVVVLGESIGVWFVNTKLNVAPDKLYAVNWVYQMSLLTFCIGLIQIPFLASIYAYERMKYFASIVLCETILKFFVAYALFLFLSDKLIIYACLMCAISIIVLLAYAIYCIKFLEGIRYRNCIDLKLLKELGGFTIFNFVINASWIFNTQGVSILINIYYGVILNAARSIAFQVEGAVSQFVNSYTTAINPQITKSYASGNLKDMYALVCRGTKFSILILLIPALPVLFETEYILKLWLKEVPDYTTVFVRLSIIAIFVNLLGNSMSTACIATGKIKSYSLWLSVIGALVFPLTWIAYWIGLEPQSTYYIYIFIYGLLFIIKLLFVNRLTGFPISMYLENVLKPIVLVIGSSCLVIFVISSSIDIKSEIIYFLYRSILCVTTVICFIMLLGLSKHERNVIMLKIRSYLGFKNETRVI